MQTPARARRRGDARPAPRAYTLIEVLVLVTILGIAAALVVPSMGQTHVLRVQAAVRTVVSDITFAQSDALAYQRGRAVMFDVDTNSYTLVEVVGTSLDPVNDALYDPHGPMQRYIVSLDDPRFGGATLENAVFDADANLIFDEMGGPVASPGSDTLSAGGSVEVVGPDTRWRINIAAFSGRVTVEQVE